MAELLTGKCIKNSTANGFDSIDLILFFSIFAQILNNLCAAGYRLAQTIAALEQWGISESCYTSQSSQTGQQASQSQQHVNFAPSPSPVATQFINAWDDLAR